MKKKIVLLCAILLGIFVTVGCTQADAGANDTQGVTVVCTNYPLYDWAVNLLKGTDANVILLLDNGADMHSFQPTAGDLIQITDCDVLVFVGGESDRWLIDALEASPNEERVVVNLMHALEDELQEETYVEGMQTEHVHADGSHHEGLACEEEHAEEESGQNSLSTMDEHIWLSPRLARQSVEKMKEAFILAMPKDTTLLEQNCRKYCEALDELDAQYRTMAENASKDTVIVADRFPFLYLMEEYQIAYYAAFPGCSTESEADFETVVFLTEKVKETDVNTILITEGGTDVLANTIWENIDKEEKKVETLHAMQVVYESDIENGCSYLSFMKENLETLRLALE